MRPSSDKRKAQRLTIQSIPVCCFWGKSCWLVVALHARYLGQRSSIWRSRHRNYIERHGLFQMFCTFEAKKEDLRGRFRSWRRLGLPESLNAQSVLGYKPHAGASEIGAGQFEVFVELFCSCNGGSPVRICLNTSMRVQRTRARRTRPKMRMGGENSTSQEPQFLHVCRQGVFEATRLRGRTVEIRSVTGLLHSCRAGS